MAYANPVPKDPNAVPGSSLIPGTGATLPSHLKQSQYDSMVWSQTAVTAIVSMMAPGPVRTLIETVIYEYNYILANSPVSG